MGSHATEQTDAPDAKAFAEQIDLGRQPQPESQRHAQVDRFMTLQRQAHALVGRRPDWVRPELHDQYCDWLAFIATADPFVRAAAEDLGHGEGLRLLEQTHPDPSSQRARPAGAVRGPPDPCPGAGAAIRRRLGDGSRPLPVVGGIARG